MILYMWGYDFSFPSNKLYKYVLENVTFHSLIFNLPHNQLIHNLYFYN